MEDKFLEQFYKEIGNTVYPPLDNGAHTLSSTDDTKNKEICLRCGGEKKENKKFKFGCSYWGKNYKKHIYK